MDFVSDLVRKCGKKNLQSSFSLLWKFSKALCKKLKQTEPYKSELKHMLVQHIFLEFHTPMGHPRDSIDFGFRIWMRFEFRPFLPPLLDEFSELRNEVENEDLVFTFETIVDKFGEEMASYALGLFVTLPTHALDFHYQALAKQRVVIEKEKIEKASSAAVAASSDCWCLVLIFKIAKVH
ncbi:hypothetical protein ACH5RR_031978 [Cinchona calisaya]|uniref:Uncharacterized protein n=1 Tax=Cinchona calisaya TaxID=153742 RepID=A0ABD2YI53_9GENT